jgi:FAD/FMN-containing dehydrogenase
VVDRLIEVEAELSAVGVAAVARLGREFRGELITPDDARYDAARAVWNGAIDRRPVLIARCTGARDVAAAVRVARELELPVSVRGGGHNVAGLGVWDGALMIDLAAMRGVRVDAARRTARAGGGAVWGDYDHETQVFGLASPGGLQSTTGIGGFTLGGGFGWLSRRYGLACDNLLEADVVLATGEVVRASADEHPDLFWGLRGGGGNFGIVTSFEYRLHSVGPDVLCGMLLFAPKDGPEMLANLRDFMESAPNELLAGCMFRTAPATPALPAEIHGTPVVSIGLCYAGGVEEGLRIVEPLRRARRPLADLVQPRPYTAWQQILDPGWGRGAHNYWKAEYLKAPTEAAIRTLHESFAEITSPLSDIKFTFLGGAIADVDGNDTAYGHRSAACILNINSRWQMGDATPHIQWTRALWTAMRPFSAGGVYVNFLGQEGAERVREAYGEAKFERLTTLKRTYDPTNFFHINQNIPPTP